MHYEVVIRTFSEAEIRLCLKDNSCLLYTSVQETCLTTYFQWIAVHKKQRALEVCESGSIKKLTNFLYPSY